MASLNPDFEVEIVLNPGRVQFPLSSQGQSQVQGRTTLVQAHATFGFTNGWTSTISQINAFSPSDKERAKDNAFVLLAAVIAAYDWPCDQGLMASNREWFSRERLIEALALLQSHESRIIIRCGGIVRPMPAVMADISRCIIDRWPAK